MWRALADFGAPLAELEIAELSTPDTFFIMGRAPNQIDIITTIDGVIPRSVVASRKLEVRRIDVHYIGLEHLIANKEAADRPQDRADVLIFEK